jgi:hypothetical protein
VAAFPYELHTVLTDNGMAFADLPRYRGRHPEIEAIFGGHIFDRVCGQPGIEHRLTKPYHLWTTDEVEQPLSGGLVLFSAGPRTSARRRAGRGMGTRPRSHHRRSSSTVPVGAFGPRRLHPSVCRL